MPPSPPSAPTLALLADAGALHTQRWAAALQEAGWRVTVYSTGGREPFGGGIPVVPIFGAHMNVSRRPLSTAAEYLRVRALLRRADIVHVHYVPANRQNRILTGLPRLLVSPWGSDVLERPGNEKTEEKRRYLRMALSQAQAILCSSAYLRDRLPELYGVRPEQLHLVYWGVDLDAFDSGRYPAPPNDTFTIGFFKHLKPYYGPSVLIHALALFDRGVGHPWRCLMYGEGELREPMQHLALAHGLAGKIAFPGKLTHDAVPAAMAACHVVVSPSVVDESLGVASLEAQALGIPVINSNLGGMPETVAPGGGFLIPPGDPEALTSALLELVYDPAKRAAMGQAGARFIRDQHLDWHTAVARVDAIQRHLLANPGRPVPQRVVEPLTP
ncbi:MAG TPA: glycosyltransferase family 4 protein [bacterium]|nr:glycosyltransferase family 4 protein [bacterium]